MKGSDVDPFLKEVMTNTYLPPVIQIPSSLLITAITQSSPMVVSVAVDNSSTEANTYIAGMAVKLFVPTSYGMYQADGLVGTILARDFDTFTLSVDSSQFDSFVIPFITPFTSSTPASLSPAGSRNYQYNNNSRLIPFQSINNIGN